jgi:hypothetical protein
MNFIPSVEQLISLAKEAEITDPLNWDLIKVDKETVYSIMASNVLEQFASLKDEEKLVIAMGTVTKLLVENFYLHMKEKLK